MASPLLLAIAEDGDRRSITRDRRYLTRTAVAGPSCAAPFHRGALAGIHRPSTRAPTTAAERLPSSLSAAGTLLTLRSAIRYFMTGRFRADRSEGLRINVRANMCATMVFLAVIRSQNELFQLGLEQEVDIAWEETMAIWKERSEARQAARQ